MTNNPLEFFKKVYCINLDERPDRWQYCVSEFDKLGVTSYERFSALKVDSLPDGSSGTGKDGHTRTYCAMIDKAINDNVENCVILEDDFNFIVRGDELYTKISEAIEQLPEQWDLLYFGANIHTDHTAIPLQKYSKALFKLNSAYATHAVAFSRRGLLALRNCFSNSKDWYIEYLEKSSPADIFLSRDFLAKHNAFITTTFLCSQMPDYSNLENRYTDYANMLKNRFEEHSAGLNKKTLTFESYRDIKGYIINLDREVEKYVTSRKELTAVGFSNIERWPATDYRNEDVVSELRMLGATRLERFSSGAEIACVLSHLRAIRHFLTTSDQYCFIFEDDVAPVENFSEMADFPDICYGDFDLLCFGGCYAGPEYHLWGMKSDLSQLHAAQMRESTHVDNCCFWQAHAYLLSRKGAYRLLQDYAEWASSPEYKKPQIDVYLSSNRNIKNKFLCNQKIANATQYMHASGRLCGILLQKNNYERSIKNIEHMEQTAKGLTVVISGSYLESHPEITFVKEVIESLELTGISHDTPILLSHDKIKPGTEGCEEKEKTYAKYFENLEEYVKTAKFKNIEIVKAPEWGHLTRTLKHAVSKVTTKYMLVLQHDIHIRREIPVLDMIELMEKHEHVKHLRFNVRRNHPTFMWWDGYTGGKRQFAEEEVDGVKLCFTPAWSDQNHLATKEYYETIVFPDCTNSDGELIYDFMENRMNGLSHHNHERYGTYIYGAYGEPRTSRHSDGRKSSPEADED